MNRLRTYLTRSPRTTTRPAARRRPPVHPSAHAQPRRHDSLPTISLTIR